MSAAVPCGSMRRFSETVGDVDLVVGTTDPATVHQAVLSLPEVAEVVAVLHLLHDVTANE